MNLPRLFPYLLFILVLASLGFSFNIGDYLYPEENESIISETNFVVDGKSYTILDIDSTHAFLLTDGEPIEEEEEIKSVLYAYYKENNYPSDAEISEILDLVILYNESRFDNGTGVMPIKEEKLCLYNLLMITRKHGKVVDLFPCYDQESCEYSELMFCSAVGDKPFSMCQPGELIEDFKHLSYSSLGNDALLGNFSEKLLDYDESNLYSSLVYVKDNLGLLKEYAVNLETSIFRTSTNFESCYYISMGMEFNCFKMCGVVDLAHETLIPELETKVDNLLNKTEPFSSYEETSENLYSETVARMQYKSNTDLRGDYLSEYELLYLEAQDLLLEVNDTVENKVTNQSLKSSANDLTLLGEDINNSLDNFNFTNMDEKLEDYISLINQTKTQLNASWVLYNSTLYHKSEAELYLFILSMKSLDLTLEQEFIELESLKFELDENLSKSIPTAKKMQKINASYALVASSLNEILEKQEENVLFLQLRSFARNVNSNLNSLLLEMNHLNYDKKKEYSSSLPLVLSVVNFVSISSFGLFLFLAAVSRIRKESRRKKRKLIFYFGLLFIFGVAVLIFSGGFFFYLDKTTNSADLNEFLLAVSAHNKTTILLDLNNVSDSNTLAMEGCADKLSNVMSSKNKTVEIYEVNDNCFKNGTQIANITSFSECMDTITSPTFYFSYSQVSSKPTVTSIFLDQLTLTGNSDYYDECIIASIFEVVSIEE